MNAVHWKRWVYLIHRWTGILACVLMALWLVSGVVMLFVGYPKLLLSERLQHLPALNSVACCVPVEKALVHSTAPDQIKHVRLTTVAGEAVYRITEGNGQLVAVNARTGLRAAPVDEPTLRASAQTFLPGPQALIEGSVVDDRWTHSRALDAHRPLFQARMADDADTRLYLSSKTGEVVMDVSGQERAWNYVGAWLHWLYMFRDGSRDPVWTWLLIVLSAIGTVGAITGIVGGIWRWRFKGRYKSGSRSPYRAPLMHWHHVGGLLFGSVLLTWMFSGLMSMNPLGIFDAEKPGPDFTAYSGATPGAVRPGFDTRATLSALQASNFDACELEWRVIAHQPFVLARNALGSTRIVAASERKPSQAALLERWPQQTVIEAGRHLFPNAAMQATWLNEFNTLYYARKTTSMYGGDSRPLPVLQLSFDDAGRTLVYIDPASGEVVQTISTAQRVGRWLFNLLHSWDLPAMLDAHTSRITTLIALSLGAAIIVGTGTVIATRRLLLYTRRRRHG